MNWQRIAWKLWGRRIAIRQVRKLIERGPIERPETPYHSIETIRRDDPKLN